MAPKCNHKGPHKKEAEGDFTHTHTRGSNVTTEAEIGVM